jgi:hypothetical protein
MLPINYARFFVGSNMLSGKEHQTLPGCVKVWLSAQADEKVLALGDGASIKPLWGSN